MQRGAGHPFGDRDARLLEAVAERVSAERPDVVRHGVEPGAGGLRDAVGHHARETSRAFRAAGIGGRTWVEHAYGDARSFSRSYRRFPGPAALNRAFTLQRDRRDAAHGARWAMLLGDDALPRCHGQGNCTDVCPMGLSPTRSIIRLRQMAVRRMVGLAAPQAGRGQ